MSTHTALEFQIRDSLSAAISGSSLIAAPHSVQKLDAVAKISCDLPSVNEFTEILQKFSDVAKSGGGDARPWHVPFLVLVGRVTRQRADSHLGVHSTRVPITKLCHYLRRAATIFVVDVLSRRQSPLS